ncbi:hypothetical protein, partial [Streptococcus pneumoniae]|uniref:hypothetical protein n=1 Tax=Streptococcus pneumoniae TaxID=1313 RepID=UPI001E45B853
TSIGLTLSFTASFTADDTAHPIPSHLYRSFLTQTFTYTGIFTGNRVTPFDPADPETYAIQTGTSSIGEGSPPDLFRS